ncbi:MAG: hypothetical protein HKN32_09185 [Flavobacteriales bacterium]|nr:hypothetical protein [Flavobacteriales bacterium]
MKRSLLLLMTIIVVVSCGKKNEIEYSTASAEDHLTSQNFFGDVFRTVYSVTSDIDGLRADNCIDEMEADTTAGALSLWINYGQDECISPDGRVRNGEIYCEFTDRWSVPGASVIVQPGFYSVDGYTIGGSVTITNLGENEFGREEFELKVFNGEIDSPDNGGSISWNCDMVLEWKEGQVSNFVEDDVFYWTGTANGVNRNGSEFEAEIQEPIEHDIVCRWFKSGMVEVTPSGREIREVDLGLGDCNELATVTVEAQTYTVSFP